MGEKRGIFLLCSYAYFFLFLIFWRGRESPVYVHFFILCEIVLKSISSSRGDSVLLTISFFFSPVLTFSYVLPSLISFTAYSFPLVSSIRFSPWGRVIFFFFCCFFFFSFVACRADVTPFRRVQSSETVDSFDNDSHWHPLPYEYPIWQDLLRLHSKPELTFRGSTLSIFPPLSYLPAEHSFALPCRDSCCHPENINSTHHNFCISSAHICELKHHLLVLQCCF